MATKLVNLRIVAVVSSVHWLLGQGSSPCSFGSHLTHIQRAEVHENKRSIQVLILTLSLQVTQPMLT